MVGHALIWSTILRANATHVILVTDVKQKSTHVNLIPAGIGEHVKTNWARLLATVHLAGLVLLVKRTLTTAPLLPVHLEQPAWTESITLLASAHQGTLGGGAR